MASWDSDNVRPGAPSSMDVLLRWLKVPGNCERWNNSIKKNLILEVIRELRAEGIMTRTPRAVQDKIYRLTTKFELTTSWLMESGQFSQYRRGNHKALQMKVNQRCPHYAELSQHFQSAQIITSGDCAGKKQKEPVAREVNYEKLADVEQKRKREPSPPKIVKSHTNAGKTQKRVAQQSQTFLSGQVFPVASTVLCAGKKLKSTPTRSSKSSIGQSTETCWDELYELKNAAHCGLEGKIVKKPLMQCELKHKEAIAKCHLDGEREREEIRTSCEKKREDVRTNCETLLSRHKLLSAGVPKHDVDAMIPL